MSMRVGQLYYSMFLSSCVNVKELYFYCCSNFRSCLMRTIFREKSPFSYYSALSFSILSPTVNFDVCVCDLLCSLGSVLLRARTVNIHPITVLNHAISERIRTSVVYFCFPFFRCFYASDYYDGRLLMCCLLVTIWARPDLVCHSVVEMDEASSLIVASGNVEPHARCLK